MKKMKRRLNRRVPFEDKVLDFDFEYWPAYPDTRLQPGEPAEINILTIRDVNGNNMEIPLIEDDGGNGTYEKMMNLLLEVLNTENNIAETTVAIEPWD